MIDASLVSYLPRLYCHDKGNSTLKYYVTLKGLPSAEGLVHILMVGQLVPKRMDADSLSVQRVRDSGRYWRSYL